MWDCRANTARLINIDQRLMVVILGHVTSTARQMYSKQVLMGVSHNHSLID